MFNKVADFLHFFMVFVGSEGEEVVVWQNLGVVLVFCLSHISSEHSVSMGTDWGLWVPHFAHRMAAVD